MVLSFLKILLIVPFTVAVIVEALFLVLIQIILLPTLLFTQRWMFHLSARLAGIGWSWVVFIYVHLAGSRIVVSGLESLPEDPESALIISNHVSFLDFVPLSRLAQERNMVAYLKYFTKRSVRYIPAFGWAMYLGGFPMLHRRWELDRKSIEGMFELFKEYRFPIWLVSFVEGSRYSDDKIKASQEFARTRGYKETRWVQAPRTRGIAASLHGVRGSHIRAVYDVTLAYHDRKLGWMKSPSFWDVIFGRVSGLTTFVHVERIPIEDIPGAQIEDANTREEQVGKWLRERFIEKDLRLESLRQQLQ